MKNIDIGINGFGRIGKCIFLQLIEDNYINIKAININNLSIEHFKDYISIVLKLLMIILLLSIIKK